MPQDATTARLVSAGVGNSSGEEVSTMDTKRKAEMTVEERANYERERNRVHARNTRARKKQYMEELKERVENMHAQRATVEREKVEAARHEEEQIQNWRSVLGKVMDLRSDGVTDEGQWKQCLAEEFRFTLPLTPYRSYDPVDIVGHRRVLVGVEGMISDVTSLSDMCGYIARKCKEKGDSGESAGAAKAPGAGADPKVHFRCFLGTGDFLFASPDGIMCMFNMRTVDARDLGAPTEIEKSGMIRACFDDGGKLQELDIMFDGIAVHQQISRVIGSDPAELHSQSVHRGQAGAEGGQNASAPSQKDKEGEKMPST